MPGGLVRRAAAVVTEGKISEVVREPDSGDLPEDRREVRVFICPGFVDLQINGAFGIDVGSDHEALQTLARELPKTGTTSFLPTLISSPIERYGGFLEADVPAAQLVHSGRHAGGLHRVGDEGEAVRTLLAVGDAERPLVYVYPVGDDAGPDAVVV